MTRDEILKEIDDTQNEYLDDLVRLFDDPRYTKTKRLNFTSPTGTGKTRMMSKLINRFPEYYFIITTLSRGSLDEQVKEELEDSCNQKNFDVYGTMSYTKHSRLKSKDILDNIPKGKRVIWLRDEAHIKTNNFSRLFDETIIEEPEIEYSDVSKQLEDSVSSLCWKIINVSATNDKGKGISCNFNHTMMLRKVNQFMGSPEKALDQLIEVKKQHKDVPNYNPCAIFRCVTDTPEILERIKQGCIDRGFKYEDLNEKTEYRIKELCKDDNNVDVIINKMKIVEGVNIKRAHVLYLDNKPGNVKTLIQIIGRCRRNALLNHPTVDIFTEDNRQLLEDTRQCYVYYNKPNTEVDEDEEGNLQYALCPFISVQELKPNITVHVNNGEMLNGLKVVELEGMTGDYKVKIDPNYGFNVVDPLTPFYLPDVDGNTGYVYGQEKITNKRIRNYKISMENLNNFPLCNYHVHIDSETGKYIFSSAKPYYNIEGVKSGWTSASIDNEVLEYFKEKRENYNKYKVKFAKNNNKISSYYYINFIIERQYNSLEELDNALTSTIEITKTDIDDLFDMINYSIKCTIIDEDKTLFDENFNKLQQNLNDLEQSFITKPEIILKGHIDPEVLKVYKEDCDWDENKLSGRLYMYENKVPIDLYEDYDRIYNDYEMSVVGFEDMYATNNTNSGQLEWRESRSITGKVGTYNKFSTFIESKYADELEDGLSQTFKGHNNFKFDKRCNSCLGWCVEYYSKYLVYGQDYLDFYIHQALNEANESTITNPIVVRACILKYRSMMTKTYSKKVLPMIKNITIEELVAYDYDEFIKTIIKLGKRTAKYIKKTLYPTIENPISKYDPQMSSRHLNGLVDYITEDTILDVKVTNYIDETYIKQVLAYHYMSTKRSDLHIKRVIVYDATSGRSVEVPITKKNWK